VRNAERDNDLADLRGRPDFEKFLNRTRALKFDPQPAMAFRGAIGWHSSGAAVPPDKGRRYLISTMLAYTSGRGNSVGEAISSLRQSVAADGKRPKGTVYFMKNADVRSVTREWGFEPAVEALAKEALRAMTNKWNTTVVALCAVIGLASAGAATVWACGGYGMFPQPAPPVSEAKPFPLESVHTTEAKPNDPPPAIERPAPAEKPNAVAAGDRNAGLPTEWEGTRPTPTGRRKTSIPVIEIARAATKAEVNEGLERWKQRHPEVVEHLEPADILTDGMRGRAYVWYRLRVNLIHVPEDKRPPQEPLDPDYNPWEGYEWPDQAGQLERSPKKKSAGTPE
jgi:hypothetical protein